MSRNISTADLLSDLQKLDEAGQDRYLQVLSPEYKEDIIRALLRQNATSSSKLSARLV